MPADTPSKVTAAHLRKDAYLYVRQSTIKQVLTNTESALRQYDLKSRAIALGWSAEQVIVIEAEQRALQRGRQRQIVLRQQQRVGQHHQVHHGDVLGQGQPVRARDLDTFLL